MKGEMCPRLQKKWGRKYWKKEGVGVMDFKNGDFIHDKRASFEEAEKFRIIEKDENATHSYTGGKGTYYCISDTGETRNIPMQLAMLWSDFKKLEFKFAIGDAVCTVGTKPGHATKWEVTSIHPAYDLDRDGRHNHRYFCKGPDKDYGTSGMYENQMVDWYKWNGKHKPTNPIFKKDDWVCLDADDKVGFADKRRIKFVHQSTDGVHAHKYEVVDVEGESTTHFQSEIIFWKDRVHKPDLLIPQPEITTIAHDAQKILEFSSRLESMVVNLENRLLNNGNKLPQFYHLIRHESSQMTKLIQEIWNHNKLNIEEDN